MFGQLKELEAGAPGFLKDLVRQFLEQGIKQISLIREFCRVRDGDGLHRAAHLLKGSAGSMGALALMGILKGLESAGQTRAWAETEKLLSSMDAEFLRVKAALEREV